MQLELYQRNEHNFVRIEWGRERPQDKDTFNKYTRAAATFKSWLEQQVLVKDDKPSIYIDEHTFTYKGKTLHRRSITCLVKLEDWSKMIIRPHEGTLARAKSDRLSMLWTLQANTSPIMSLYEDSNKAIVSLVNQATHHKTSFIASNINGESHRVWALSDNIIIARIQARLANQPFYIADGHHRYESALTYQRERRSTLSLEAEEAPFDFVMMTLVDIADPGLVILPAHRLVRGLANPALEDLVAKLDTFFNVTEHPINEKDIASQIKSILTKGNDKLRLILCGLKPNLLLELTVRNAETIRPMFPAFHSELYQKLDVSIVDHVILEELLGLTHEKAGAFLDYNYDAAESVNKVLDGEYQLGIIVNPVKPNVIKAIADSGDRMPKKSTYFYPKAPAGLVAHHFA
jgi:uncharacterized protein (DUF1015 family)